MTMPPMSDAARKMLADWQAASRQATPIPWYVWVIGIVFFLVMIPLFMAGVLGLAF